MIHVKVKLKGRDAKQYLGQLALPGSGSPAPRIQVDRADNAPKKKRVVVLGRGKKR